MSCSVQLQDITPNVNTISDLNKLCDDSFAEWIYKWKSQRCKLKIFFLFKTKFVRTTSKQMFDCVTPFGTIYLDYHSPNVLYIITCSEYSLQYAGETGQRRDLIGIRHVSKTLKIYVFSRYYLIIFLKEYVKMLIIQSKFWEKCSLYSPTSEKNALYIVQILRKMLWYSPNSEKI